MSIRDLHIAASAHTARTHTHTCTHAHTHARTHTRTHAHASPSPLPTLHSHPLGTPRPPSSPSLSPDGCWFFLAPGSGIWLNVSRTRVARTREELRATWHLPHHGSEYNDAHLCRSAMGHGYDSMQILMRSTGAATSHATSGTSGVAHPAGGGNHNPHPAAHLLARHAASALFQPPELVLCSGACVREESNTPCPGVPLQRTDGSPCTCDRSFPLLRCIEDAGRQAAADPCPAHGTARLPT